MYDIIHKRAEEEAVGCTSELTRTECVWTPRGAVQEQLLCAI